MDDQMDLVSRVSSTAKRLSIIVPLHGDAMAFEETLVSVLENRPSDAEILVCHDGRYDDPFELGDEVKFVTAESPSFVELVLAGARSAGGRFSHVIAGGIKATSGWTEGALEKLQHSECGSVVPVVRDCLGGKVVAAGWQDSVPRLCAPASKGRDSVEQSTKTVGAFLQASFWRTDLLCSLSDAYAGVDATAVSVVYDHLSRGAGWQCLIADTSELVCEDESVLTGTSGFSRGRMLRALRNHFCDGGWSTAIHSSIVASLACVVQPSLLSEAVGQALGPIGASGLIRRIRQDEVLRCDDGAKLLEFAPSQELFTDSLPSRRAA